MAKKKKKKHSQNIPAIVITAIAALLAIAAVVFLIKTINSEGGWGTEEPTTTTTEDPGFIPTQDLISETEQAAYTLLNDNFTVYHRLTRGTSYKEEPYGNLPEDGFYTCVDSEFPTFEVFSDYVRSIYTAEAAEKLLTNPFGNGPIYGDDNGELGISADFAPSEDLETWTGVDFVCTPVSEEMCELEVTLKTDDGNEAVKKVSMVLEDGMWKLSDLVG